MRLVVPGVTLTALGFQTMLSSFFVEHHAPACSGRPAIFLELTNV